MNASEVVEVILDAWIVPSHRNLHWKKTVNLDRFRDAVRVISSGQTGIEGPGQRIRTLLKEGTHTSPNNGRRGLSQSPFFQPGGTAKIDLRKGISDGSIRFRDQGNPNREAT